MTQIILVRHGESEWNHRRLLQGQADIGLSERGREQARALAPVIERLVPDLALVSDLHRVQETARLMGISDYRIEPALREINVGDWTGQSIDALIAQDAEQYAGWRAGGFTPLNGEPWSEFRARVAGVVEAGHRLGLGRLLLVAHGGVIRAVLQHCLGLDPAQIVPVAPASLSILRLRPGDPAEAKLELFNYRPGELNLSAPD